MSYVPVSNSFYMRKDIYHNPFFAFSRKYIRSIVLAILSSPIVIAALTLPVDPDSNTQRVSIQGELSNPASIDITEVEIPDSSHRYINHSDLRNQPYILVSEEDAQLKRIYDYTRFHIGLYLTLSTGILAALKYKTPKDTDNEFILPLGFLLAAGVCGGIVGSNIPNYLTYSSEYVEVKLLDGQERKNQFVRVIPFIEGVHRFYIPLKEFDISYSKWIRLEHTAFWLAVACLLILVMWDAESKDESEKTYKLSIKTDGMKSAINGESLFIVGEGELGIQTNSSSNSKQQ